MTFAFKRCWLSIQMSMRLPISMVRAVGMERKGDEVKDIRLSGQARSGGHCDLISLDGVESGDSSLGREMERIEFVHLRP